MSKEKHGFILQGDLRADLVSSNIADNCYTLTYTMRFGLVDPCDYDANDKPQSNFLREDMQLEWRSFGYLRERPVTAESEYNDYYSKRAISPLDMPAVYVRQSDAVDKLMSAWTAKQYYVHFNDYNLKTEVYSLHPRGSTGQAYALLGKALAWFDSDAERKFLVGCDDAKYRAYCQMDLMALTLWRLDCLGVRPFKYATDARGDTQYHRMDALDNNYRFTWDNICGCLNDTNRRLRGEW